MISTRRFFTVFWVLGVAVLVGSGAGASWVLYSQASDGVSKDKVSASAPVPEDAAIVTCGIGHVDVKSLVRSLYPLQPGRVEQVLVEENQTVEAGAVLLSVDKDLAES